MITSSPSPHVPRTEHLTICASIVDDVSSPTRDLLCFSLLFSLSESAPFKLRNRISDIANECAAVRPPRDLRLSTQSTPEGDVVTAWFAQEGDSARSRREEVLRSFLAELLYVVLDAAHSFNVNDAKFSGATAQVYVLSCSERRSLAHHVQALVEDGRKERREGEIVLSSCFWSSCAIYHSKSGTPRDKDEIALSRRLLLGVLTDNEEMMRMRSGCLVDLSAGIVL